MKRTFIRALAMALAVIMSLTGIAFTISAASFSDTGSHWSNQYVDYMAKKAIIAGYGDGTFKPDNKVSRAEFIKMLVETFGLTAVGPFVYNDVKETDWFYPYIGKAAAQGFLIPGSNYLDPNGQLTRAEAAALLVRYLDLPADMTVATNYYPDYNTISSIYRTYVLQATAAGLFKGYEDGAFRPNNTLTRAEAMTILYRAAGSIYNESARGIDEGANTENAVVTKAGVNVSDANLRGNVIISEGAESGTVMFSNSNINGTLFVRGKVKVNLTNTKVNKLVVDSDAGYSVNVILAGNTNVDLAELRSRAGVTINTGTTVGALAIFFLRRPSSRMLVALISGAAGIMLAASFFSLLQPAFEYAVGTPQCRGRPRCSPKLAGCDRGPDRLNPALHDRSRSGRTSRRLGAGAVEPGRPSGARIDG